MCWNEYFTNVPNMDGNADENSTAVATVPVPTNSTYGRPPTVETSVPKPKPKASR